MGGIPVVYILSTGRSGTTLLDLLLGAHPSMWTLGEAQVLPWELREQRYPCGCGREIEECPFWEAVLPDLTLEEEEYPIHFFREGHNTNEVIRPDHLRDLIRGEPGGRWREAIRRYGEANARFFKTVLEEVRKYGDVRWLIDASKDPYRLFWLAESGRFDLRVLHVTKDPRGFVYSMIKRDPGSSSMFEAGKMALRWSVQNAVMNRLRSVALSEGHARLVRYEDLAREPDRVSRTIASWLDLDPVEALDRGFRTYENHAVSGNPMRWEDTDEIRLDDRWRSRLPATFEGLSWMLTFPWAHRYGYTREAA